MVIIKKFLSYIEIKTKITSLFAFLYALCFLFYQGQKINWKLTAIFFVSMLLLDLTTTAVNNYIDTKTNHQTLQFNKRAAFIILFVLLVLSVASGLYLVFLSDLVILLAGTLCFLCGILYTYGPLPISRQPLGEIFSGVFYGFFIPFILLYINMPKGHYLTLGISTQTINLVIHILPFLQLFLLSVLPVCATAGIMLANNICDLELDVAVKRHTLVYYIGLRRSLHLFALLYYLTYIAVLAMVVLKTLPLISLSFLFTIIIVQKNINLFYIKQEKETTFHLSIINYIVIMSAASLVLSIGALI